MNLKTEQTVEIETYNDIQVIAIDDLGLGCFNCCLSRPHQSWSCQAIGAAGIPCLPSNRTDGRNVVFRPAYPAPCKPTVEEQLAEWKAYAQTLLAEIKMLSDPRRNIDPGTRGSYERLLAIAPKE